ncbi:MAG: RluA family pseudouridine synthase [Clostridia bacterium]|nr:RluA family pseudouridine synthase [Clostridia bacterium]
MGSCLMIIKINGDETGNRIDAYISEIMEDVSRSYVQKLISTGAVLVNDNIIKAGYKLRDGDSISIDIPGPETLDAVPEDIPIEIIYEDDHIIVVNKPRGMVVHPAPGNYNGTLVNALLFHCKGRLSSINGVERPGIVHRIDKDTSGILVVAKSDQAHRTLSDMFSRHDIQREYTAITVGVISENAAKIDAPIGRHHEDRQRMGVNLRNGKEAVTHFTVLERFRKTTLIKAVLETGRTHQIRVHMAYIGYPLAGDTTYGRGKRKFNIEGQALHAGRLAFNHPVTGEFMSFEAEPPSEFMELLEELRNE